MCPIVIFFDSDKLHPVCIKLTCQHKHAILFIKLPQKSPKNSTATVPLYTGWGHAHPALSSTLEGGV